MAQLQDSVRCGFRAWYKRCRVWGFGFGLEGVQSSTSRFQRRLQLQIYLACSVVYHFKLLSPATAASFRVQSLGFGVARTHRCHRRSSTGTSVQPLSGLFAADRHMSR